jgi:hydroxyacylglutathione hydrolase
VHIGAGELPEVLDRLPHDREVALVCASGYRSSIAASLLRAGGFSRVAAVAGGTPDWEAHGYPLDYGAGTDGLDWPATPAAPAHSHDA